MTLLNSSLSLICLAVVITATSPRVSANEQMPGGPEKPIRPGSDPFGCKKRGSSSGSGCVALIEGKSKKVNKIVKLSQFDINGGRGSLVIHMSRVGVLFQNKIKIGKIKTSGIVEDKNGLVVANLDSNGVLLTKNGIPFGKISPDGAIDNGSGTVIHWLHDGSLARGNEVLPIKIIPAESPALRAASIAVALYFSI